MTDAYRMISDDLVVWPYEKYTVSRIYMYRTAKRRPRDVSGHPRAWYLVSFVSSIPPSAYSYEFVGTFSCARIDLRKARERELATLDEKSTSSGIAEPYA